MAQGKGVWGKILNFIGLVDDEDTQDTYDDTETATNNRPNVNNQYNGYGQNNRTTTGGQRRTTASASRSSGSRPSGERENSQQRRGVGSYTSSRGNSRNDYQQRNSRFNDPQPRQETTQAEPRIRQQRQTLVTVRLETLDDCCDVIDNLILNKTVALNMEELDNSTMQRCIDTLSGAVFALDATIKKIGEGTYMLAPKYVEVSEIYSEHRI